MDLAFSAADLAFRDHVHSTLDQALPADLRAKAERGESYDHADARRWHGILHRLGWVAPHWPTEHGGTGWDVTQRFIFNEELQATNTPPLSGFGLTMVGPLLIQYGTTEQQQRFLPKILSGEDWWCQGYSEPNAGSDLASLKLRAERDGDDYVLNGQKTWTSAAQYADWIFLLCRTGASGKKQEGITFLLADLETPGIVVRPFRSIGGTLSFCDTFFENARVPQHHRVGAEGQGWTVAKALLGHERTSIGGASSSARWLRTVERIARDTPVGSARLIDDPAFQRRLARLCIRHRALVLANYRTLAAAQLGRAPGPESSILKLVGTELQQEITELAMDALGLGAQGWLDAPPDTLLPYQRTIASEFNYLRASTIYGGSNEIQRNVIAKNILRLPGA